jgi:hypothetical protein
MQRQGWLRHHVFEAADLIQQLPPEDRLPITQVLDQPGIPPEKAIGERGGTRPRACQIPKCR